MKDQGLTSERCGDPFVNGCENCFEMLTNAVALHYEFAEDDCCDPATYSAECNYRQVCHECGQDWPCDTARVAAGAEAVVPGRRDA